jgi:hypothetical protein
MRNWNRSTIKSSLDQIPPEIWGAIQEHLETYNIKSVFDDYLICIQTESQVKKKKLFGGGIAPNKTLQVVIVTPRWLVIGSTSDKSKSAGALSIQLKDSIVKDYKENPGYQLIQDVGVDVTGAFTGIVGMHGNAYTSHFIGLGEEPVASEFKNLLFELTQKAREEAAL